MEIRSPSLNVVAGSCGLGKSHLVRYLAYTLAVQKKIDYAVYFSMTPEELDYVPPDFVHFSFDEGKLADLMRLQKRLKSEGRPRSCLLVFDDCLGAVNFGSRLMTILVSQFRHYGLTVVFSTQYLYKIPPLLRECATYAFIFRQSTLRSIQAAYDSYGQRYRSLQEFKTHLERSTGDFGILWVDLRAMDPAAIYRAVRAPARIPAFRLSF